MIKYKRLIFSMIISMVISLIVIYFLKHKFNELSNSDTLVNIFIGIFGSSFITMISYIFELFSEKQISKQRIIQYYREVNFTIIPYIKTIDDRKIIQIMEDKIIYNIRDLLNDYKLTSKILIFMNNKIEKYFYVTILDVTFIPKYLKILYVLIKIHDYLTQINTYIFCTKYLLNVYMSCYRFLKSNGLPKEQIKQNVYQTKVYYKEYKKAIIKEKERMISDIIWTKCMFIDASVGLINTKNDFHFYDN